MIPRQDEKGIRVVTWEAALDSPELRAMRHDDVSSVTRCCEALSPESALAW